MFGNMGFLPITDEVVSVGYLFTTSSYFFQMNVTKILMLIEYSESSHI